MGEAMSRRVTCLTNTPLLMVKLTETTAHVSLARFYLDSELADGSDQQLPLPPVAT